jgi:hypothetical protein
MKTDAETKVYKESAGGDFESPGTHMLQLCDEQPAE